MMRSVLQAASAGSLLLFLFAACAGREVAPAPSLGDPRDFYPMNAGNAWSYDVDTGDGTTTLAVTRVESFDGRFAALRTADATIRYEAMAEGIRAATGDAWLLRAPLEVGATWPAPGGREAELLSRRASVTTAAGAFEHCIEVVELGGKLDVEVHTVYCPGVGPVSVSSTMRSSAGDRSLTVFARLRGYRVNPMEAPDR
jgi:hypothetical protein